MSKIIDLTDKRFGRLTVISFAGQDKHHFAHWLCRCDCGNEKVISGSALRSGVTVSCGCYRLEQANKANTRHNLSHTRIYTEWRHMKDRCLNKNHKAYSYYGGRGISVCPEWINDVSVFADWAYSNGYKEGLTLDRIDPNGNYEPNNCRWISQAEQMANTRRCRVYEINCEKHTLSEWCKIYNVPYERTRTRLNQGWNIEKALTTPSLLGRNGTSAPLDSSYFT